MMLWPLLVLTAASADPAHPSWMVGSWAWQNAGEQGADCGSDHMVTYHRNGTYEFIDTSGTWRIDGNRLIEVQTDPGESGDPTDTGKPHVIKFKRVSTGVLGVSGEYPGKLIKCPAG